MSLQWTVFRIVFTVVCNIVLHQHPSTVAPGTTCHTMMGQSARSQADFTQNLENKAFGSDCSLDQTHVLAEVSFNQ